MSIIQSLFHAMRAGIFYLGYGVLIIWFSLTGVLFLSFVSYHKRMPYLLYWNKLAVAWVRLICGVKFEVTGLENLPASPYVALSKHQSQWETFYLQYALAPVSLVLKQELLFIPVFGWGLKLTDPIAINRSTPRNALKQILEKGAERLSNGISVLIFPEGTRMAPGSKGNYARSGAQIAINAEVPVVPIAHNAGRHWPADHFRKVPGTISVIIGKPIASAGKNSRELTAEVERWIETEMARLPNK